MANIKKKGTQRRAIQVMLSPEAIDFAEVKGMLPNFMRGKRGGRSRAIEAMIFFARDYERAGNQ